MSHLPVIVGFGGINTAGRSSFHHGYRRLVIDRIQQKDRESTLLGLAVLMRILRFEKGKFLDAAGTQCLPADAVDKYRDHILANTLLRKIDPGLVNTAAIAVNKPMTLHLEKNNAVTFTLSSRDLPGRIPANWEIKDDPGDANTVQVRIRDTIDMLFSDVQPSPVQSAGQLPTGFDPGLLYNSRNHPRGIQMAIFGATDALYSTGIEWAAIKKMVPPDKIGVYASSAMGQMDDTGNGGMMKAHVLGKRTSSKQLAMGLVQMPADFINAYVLGNVGPTSAQIGACATMLYNLKAAISDIRSGKVRVAIVGSAEAPLIPEIFDGYRAMGALAEDKQIEKLDLPKAIKGCDHRRSCRPFGYNCGFTLAESSQYFVLFDDQLVVETGAMVYGSMADVFIHADGFKKSISSPGFGNYISLAKAVAFTRSIIGEQGIRERSFLSAHGTGTPQNRTTESHGLNEVAKAFGIKKWPVSAIKCYLGHPLGPASGDQVAAVLGTWEYGLIPGIFTLDEIADDVFDSNLLLSQDHLDVGRTSQDAALINAKGFGGNNATGVVLSPEQTEKLIFKKHGQQAKRSYLQQKEQTVEKASQYDESAIRGKVKPIYHFDKNVLDGEDLDLTDRKMTVPGYDQPIDLNLSNPYMDMTE